MAGDSHGDTQLSELAFPPEMAKHSHSSLPLQPSYQPCPPEDEAPKHITGCETRTL